MTAEQKRLVQVTFQQVLEKSDVAAALFYSRLFELNPELRSMFKGNLIEQGRRLIQIIGALVNMLDHLDDLVAMAQGLGPRHASYGVREEDYKTMGDALIWTLQKSLGPAFTTEMEIAWATVYRLLASVMQTAASVAA